jgi:glycosyltransferase involved in cell wall biosynthesis
MRVSIGMPVYNGEQFIAEAIDSILAQSFRDFELLISDNASTDATQQICERYAEREPRIHYSRLPENLGAARNYNRVFEMSSGTYFKWAAHDDILHPDFIKRCVRAFESLETPPALIYPQGEFIDATGKTIGQDHNSMNADSRWPARRVLKLFQILQDKPMVTAVFGLFRRDILNRTSLIGSFVSSDYVLLLQAALLGNIIQLNGDPLFQRRIHANMSRKANVTDEEVLRWFDPSAVSRLSVEQKLYLEYFKSILDCKNLGIGARGLSATAVMAAIALKMSTIALKGTRAGLGRFRRQLLQGRAPHWY